jgi:hypothetical protein
MTTIRPPRAGDGNRTRIISLGTAPPGRDTGPDLRVCVAPWASSDPCGPGPVAHLWPVLSYRPNEWDWASALVRAGSGSNRGSNRSVLRSSGGSGRCQRFGGNDLVRTATCGSSLAPSHRRIPRHRTQRGRHKPLHHPAVGRRCRPRRAHTAAEHGRTSLPENRCSVGVDRAPASAWARWPREPVAASPISDVATAERWDSGCALVRGCADWTTHATGLSGRSPNFGTAWISARLLVGCA